MTASTLSESPTTQLPEPAPAETDRSFRVHQVVTLIATVCLFGGAFNSWNTIIHVPWTGVVCMATMLGAVLLGVRTVTAATVQQLHRLDIGVLLMGLLVLAGTITATLYFRAGYATDEAAFVHQAAQVLLEGRNPYGADLSEALSRFRVPIQYATVTMDGQTVDTLGYPPLSVLITAVLIPFTSGVQTVAIGATLALAATMVLMFLLLPAPWKSLAVLLGIGLPIMPGYAQAGVNAMFALPFLVIAAAGWARIGESGKLSKMDVLRALSLGCAAAIQPLVWFVIPFVVAGLWLLRGGARIAWRFTAIGAAVFVAFNLPFVVWNPSTWLVGVAEPLTQHAIPYGQGLIDLSMFFGIGGGALEWYNYAGACIGLATFVLYVLYFRKLGIAAWILPWACFFFATRSLGAYFMILVPIWFVSLVTVSRHDFAAAAQPAIRWLARARVAVPLALVPGLLCTGVAVATPPPLKIEILGLATSGQLQTVWNLKIKATNTSDEQLKPRFATNSIGQPTTMWNVVKGPEFVPANTTVEYDLTAPNAGSMPAVTSPFLVHAFTAEPRTISTSPRFVPQSYSTTVMPNFINDPQRPGTPVKLKVRLKSNIGEPVRKAGVRVALGQFLNAGNRLIAGDGRINAGAQSETPVHAATDEAGEVTFTVTADAKHDQPLYYQAWVEEDGGYVFGHSEVVSISWSGE